MRRRVSVSAMLALLAALTVLPGLAQASPPPPQAQYFKETGHAAHNWYWQFWKNTPDALRILGYPVSEPFNQESFTEPGRFYRVSILSAPCSKSIPRTSAATTTSSIFSAACSATS